MNGWHVHSPGRAIEYQSEQDLHSAQRRPRATEVTTIYTHNVRVPPRLKCTVQFKRQLRRELRGERGKEPRASYPHMAGVVFVKWKHKTEMHFHEVGDRQA